MGVMFFVPIVNVRSLPKEHYGYYRQFWLLFDTLTPLLILGFPRSLLYYFPRAESPRAKDVYLTQTLAFLFVTSLVAVGVYTLMERFGGEGLGELVRAFYLRLSLFTVFMMMTHYLESLFVAEKQVVRQAVYNAVTAAAQAILVMILSWTTHDVNVVIWGLAFFALGRFLFATGYTFSVYRPSLRLISLHTVKDQLSFALPVGLAGVSLVLVAQTDKFIINRFMGREAFAVYAIGAFQVPLVDVIRGSVVNVTYPLMAQYQKEGNNAAIAELWRRSLLKTAVLFLPLFVFLELSARPFVQVLFTREYLDAAPVFAVYLLLFLRSTVETGTIIQVFKKTRFIASVFAVGFVVNLVLSLIMFEMMGRMGVPIATVITMYAITFINVSYACGLLGVSFKDLLPSAALLKRFVVALVPGVVVWLGYRRVVVDNIFELAAAGAVYFLLYFLMCSRAGYISTDDIRSLLGRSSS